jgi:hypothetical protein
MSLEWLRLELAAARRRDLRLALAIAQGMNAMHDRDLWQDWQNKMIEGTRY